MDSARLSNLDFTGGGVGDAYLDKTGKQTYIEEETEYSKAYGPKAPYSKPERPAWFASRNISGFEVGIEAGDSVAKIESETDIEKTIHRNASCFDISVEQNSKFCGVTSYMRAFSREALLDKDEPPPKPSKTNIGKVRRPATIPLRSTQSLDTLKKKAIDDNEDTNPSLRYFINLIARK